MLLERGFADMVVDCESAMMAMTAMFCCGEQI
jgi:hypothetical protein